MPASSASSNWLLRRTRRQWRRRRAAATLLLGEDASGNRHDADDDQGDVFHVRQPPNVRAAQKRQAERQAVTVPDREGDAGRARPWTFILTPLDSEGLVIFLNVSSQSHLWAGLAIRDTTAYGLPVSTCR